MKTVSNIKNLAISNLEYLNQIEFIWYKLYEIIESTSSINKPHLTLIVVLDDRHGEWNNELTKK